MTMVPGAGEIFHVGFRSFDGPTSAITIEAVPGGLLDVLDGVPNLEVASAVLALVKEFAPRARHSGGYQRVRAGPPGGSVAWPAEALADHPTQAAA
jgi:hypothetical protein